MTKVRIETEETLDAWIDRLEAEVVALNRRWAPFSNVYPTQPGHLFAGGAAYDPSRLIQRRRIDVELDGANAALAEAKAERARQRLAELGTSEPLRAAFAAAEAEEGAAREAFRAAQAATREALARVQWRDERAGAWWAEAQRAAADEARWRRELEKDRAQLAELEQYAAATGRAA